MSDDHLDDDALSAALDGFATDEQQAHLRACAACGAAVARLEQVVALVGAPVTSPADAVRDEQIHRAIRAPKRAAVPTLAERRRRPPPAALAAIAAVVVALVVAVPVLLSDRDDDPITTAAEPDATSQARTMGGAVDDAGSLPQLGEVADEVTLRRALTPFLDPADLSASMATDSPPEGSEAAGGATGGDRAGSEFTTREVADCGAVARGDPPDQALVDLILVASATWQDRPAQVYVFTRPDGTYTAVVLAAEDCAPLAEIAVPAA
jgi:hypothetical protein